MPIYLDYIGPNDDEGFVDPFKYDYPTYYKSPTYTKQPHNPNRMKGFCKYCKCITDWMNKSELWDLGWNSRAFDKMNVCPNCIKNMNHEDLLDDIARLRSFEGPDSILRKVNGKYIKRTIDKTTGRLVQVEDE